MNKKGFTLAELLIVVAIIGVLVSIGIPVFSSQLEKAREATDAANIRDAYAEMMTTIISEGDTTKKYQVNLSQQKDDWQTSFDFPATEIGIPKKGGVATIEYKDQIAYINYGNADSNGGTSNDVEKKSVLYPSDFEKGERTSKGTLYKYNDQYFIATKDGEMDETPKDNTHGLYLVNINSVHIIDTFSEESFSTIKNIKKGDVIYVKSENKYYVYYDTNQKVKVNSDLQEIL